MAAGARPRGGGDSGFSALLFLDAMRRARITAITRLRLDTALYDPAPPRPPGTIGRLRTKGARRPTLAATLAAEDTRWHAVVVPGWYGAGERTIEIASDTAVWRHGGLPVAPIRWVLIRDPTHRKESPFAPTKVALILAGLFGLPLCLLVGLPLIVVRWLLVMHCRRWDPPSREAFAKHALEAASLTEPSSGDPLSRQGEDPWTERGSLRAS
ncbi:hypothetical protein [Methylobacterium oryzae]|uniref:Uncharacterized protein n=1 Tax=Methylobacterium oryzae TaxID=334852 RepID=A0ABU7TS26_9HYPH